jgi:hypothetical protein
MLDRILVPIQVVVSLPPHNPTYRVCKRVKAIAGDVIYLDLPRKDAVQIVKTLPVADALSSSFPDDDFVRGYEKFV